MEVAKVSKVIEINAPNFIAAQIEKMERKTSTPKSFVKIRLE
jgi:hypothetical protein